MIEISHISTGEMAADGLTKALLSNKFKEFVELIRVSKIEASSNSEASNSEASNSKSNNGKSSDDKNNGNLAANYYKEAGKEEISFKAEEAE